MSLLSCVCVCTCVVGVGRGAEGCGGVLRYMYIVCQQPLNYGLHQSLLHVSQICVIHKIENIALIVLHLV